MGLNSSGDGSWTFPSLWRDERLGKRDSPEDEQVSASCYSCDCRSLRLENCVLVLLCWFNFDLLGDRDLYGDCFFSYSLDVLRVLVTELLCTSQLRPKTTYMGVVVRLLRQSSMFHIEMRQVAYVEWWVFMLLNEPHHQRFEKKVGHTSLNDGVYEFISYRKSFQTSRREIFSSPTAKQLPHVGLQEPSRFCFNYFWDGTALELGNINEGLLH